MGGEQAAISVVAQTANVNLEADQEEVEGEEEVEKVEKADQEEAGGQEAGHENARLEADAADVDSDVEDLYAVPAPGTVVLVQTKSKYKWPGRVVGSDGTQLTVQLFDKPGLKGQRRSFEASAVEVFQYSRELDDMVQTTTNNELKNAYKKALDIVYRKD